MAVSFIIIKLSSVSFHLGARVWEEMLLLKAIFFLVGWYCIFMATGIFSITLEDLKQQTDEFGLEGKIQNEVSKQRMAETTRR